MPTQTSSSSPLSVLSRGLAALIRAFHQVPSRSFLAHVLVVGLSALVLTLAPSGFSSELNGLIVVLAGLLAHVLVPGAQTKS